MWFYGYEVEVFDENEKKMVIRCGTVAAATLIEATEKICNYYGEAQINEIKLHIIEDSEGGIIEEK